MSHNEFQCAPWCSDRGTPDEGHPGYHYRADQSCWGPARKTVFSLDYHAPGATVDPIPSEATGITVYPYLGWYQLPKVKLNVYHDPGDINPRIAAVDHTFELTPSEAIELANHLLAAAETITGGGQ